MVDEPILDLPEPTEDQIFDELDSIDPHTPTDAPIPAEEEVTDEVEPAQQSEEVIPEEVVPAEADAQPEEIAEPLEEVGSGAEKGGEAEPEVGETEDERVARLYAQLNEQARLTGQTHLTSGLSGSEGVQSSSPEPPVDLTEAEKPQVAQLPPSREELFQLDASGLTEEEQAGLAGVDPVILNKLLQPVMAKAFAYMQQETMSTLPNVVNEQTRMNMQVAAFYGKPENSDLAAVQDYHKAVVGQLTPDPNDTVESLLQRGAEEVRKHLGLKGAAVGGTKGGKASKPPKFANNTKAETTTVRRTGEANAPAKPELSDLENELLGLETGMSASDYRRIQASTNKS